MRQLISSALLSRRRPAVAGPGRRALRRPARRAAPHEGTNAPRLRRRERRGEHGPARHHLGLPVGRVRARHGKGLTRPAGSGTAGAPAQRAEPAVTPRASPAEPVSPLLLFYPLGYNTWCLLSHVLSAAGAGGPRHTLSLTRSAPIMSQTLTSTPGALDVSSRIEERLRRGELTRDQ